MSGTSAEARRGRIGELIGLVARQALADRGAERIALLDDGGPEAALASEILSAALGPEGVVRVDADAAHVEPLLHAWRGIDAERAREEMRRMRARLLPGALAANSANKTALLLMDELPPEPLLPLGDLWATDVASLAGAWSAPDAVRRLADEAGGIEALDAALRAVIDRRDWTGLAALSSSTEAEVRRRLTAGRAARMHPRIVPKLGGRTLGVDLFE